MGFSTTLGCRHPLGVWTVLLSDKQRLLLCVYLKLAECGGAPLAKAPYDVSPTMPALGASRAFPGRAFSIEALTDRLPQQEAVTVS